jgi:hypothetical protein
MSQRAAGAPSISPLKLSVIAQRRAMRATSAALPPTSLGGWPVGEGPAEGRGGRGPGGTGPAEAGTEVQP